MKKTPVIWMNVTTSSRWNRPPVGIVRVEMALRDELAKLLPADVFKLCVWEADGFVEWDQGAGQVLAGVPGHGDVIITLGLDWDQPYKEKLFELSRDRGLRFVTCIYDLIPALFPQYCVGDVAAYFKEYFNTLAWSSSAVLCISQQTEKDFKALCVQFASPSKPTYVIELGDNVPTGGGDVGPDVKAVLARPFVLFVSTIERRKNHEVLYRAYHLLARQGRAESLPRLVFVGMPGWGVGDLLKDIELDPWVRGKIIQLNHVNDAELNALYKGADFCVYPSLYEGWGLPVGEALAMGKAVMASNQGSLPEVGGSLVRYVEAWNPYAWAEAIDDWVSNPGKRAEVEAAVRRQYKPRSWTNTAVTVRDVALKTLGLPSAAMGGDLFPGYDFSTQVGVHVGAELWSTGVSGYLMFGPHRSLPAGRYRVSLFDRPAQRTSGVVHVDVVCNAGATVLGMCRLELAESHADAEEAMLSALDIVLPENAVDYEVRVMVGTSALALNRVSIVSLQ